MLCSVLRHFSLAELVTMKLVCKSWNQLISSQLKLTRLVVVGYATKKEKWWHVSRPVDEYLEVCPPQLFITQLRQPILAKLRYLRIDLYEELDGFKLNDLNAFDQLVHLEVNYPINDLLTEISWNLPNLELLRYGFGRLDYECAIQMSIDCKKLRVLACGNSFENDSVDVKSPKTIRMLWADFRGAKLAKFENTETYRYSGELRFVDDALIRCLPKLKVLEIYGELETLFQQLETTDAMRKYLKRLLNHKRKAMQPDLKLFFAGVEIRDEALVDRLDLRVVLPAEGYYARLSSEHLYFGDYPADCKPTLMDEMKFISDANYGILMSLVDELPANYFKQFWNIRCIIVNGPVKDPAHFLSYISQLEYVDFLDLFYPGLSQDWYDQLPTICNLQSFTLQEKQEIELNFDFLSRFEPYIYVVNIIDRDLPLNSAGSIPNLIKSFKNWHERKFRFKFRGAESLIRKRKADEDSNQSEGSVITEVELDDDYDVLVNKKLKLERANSMEIINYFEKLEQETSSVSSKEL